MSKIKLKDNYVSLELYVRIDKFVKYNPDRGLFYNTIDNYTAKKNATVVNHLCKYIGTKIN